MKKSDILEMLTARRDRGECSHELLQDFRILGEVADDYEGTCELLRQNQGEPDDHTEVILESDYFKSLFTDPLMSVQPMRGPLTLAFSKNYREKTAVEAGSYPLVGDPVEAIKDLIASRRKFLEEGQILVFLPYVIFEKRSQLEITKQDMSAFLAGTLDTSSLPRTDSHHCRGGFCENLFSNFAGNNINDEPRPSHFNVAEV